MVAGEESEAEAVAEHFAALGRKTKRLRVSHAFHSPLMEPVLEEFRTVVAGLTPQTPVIPVVSGLTGTLATVEQLASPDYWADHARHTVRFADTLAWLDGHGTATYLELGPDGVLSAMAQSCLAAADDAADGVPATLAVLRKGRPEAETLTAALAGLHTRGVAVQWAALLPGHRRAARRPAHVRLPAPPLLAPERAGAGGDVRAAGLGAAHHPLLAAAVSVGNSDGLLLTGRLSRRTHPWLADHAVRGTVLLPGTAFLELAVRAGDEAGCGRVEELTLAAPLVLPEEGGVQVQVWVGSPDESGRRAVSVHSRPDGPEELPWTQHATGTLVAGAHRADFDATVWPPAGARPLDLDGFYDRMADNGFGYGPLFQGLHAAWRSGDAVYAEVTLPGADGADAASATSFGIHPALLDAALHAAAFADLGEQARGGLPFAWQDVTLHASGASTVRVTLIPADDDAVAIAVADTSGAPVASIGSLVLRSMPAEELGGAAALVRDALFEVRWTEARQAAQAAPAAVAVLGTDLFGLEQALASPDRTVAALPGLDAMHRRAGRDPRVRRGCGRRRGHRRRTRRDRPALELLRTWLADERYAASRLVFVTRGAVATGAAGAGPGGRRRAGASYGRRRASTPAASRWSTSTRVPPRPPPSRCRAPWPCPRTSRRPPYAGPVCWPRGWPAPRRSVPRRTWDPEGTVLLTGARAGWAASGPAPGRGARRTESAARQPQGPGAEGAEEFVAELRDSARRRPSRHVTWPTRPPLPTWSARHGRPLWCIRPVSWTTAWWSR
ncbi:Type I polyketide synthase OS=Streptomyces rimosus subsp. rimosus (strain ATCC / DSM 40260 / JCM 4667 / NRRL 2234) OX=1265868 GN=SRIM_038775 PE=4 SV=1 [Streptomyces rimosus subsp. rimosus]